MFFNAFPQTVLTWDSRSEKHDYFSALLFNDLGENMYTSLLVVH